MKAKTHRRFLDTGFGFPVWLRNVPMVKVRGVWTPKVNHNHLARLVLGALSRKATRLTGNQVRFARLHFEMTQSQFGRRFGMSHVAVVKWEKVGNKPIKTEWTTEKDIRLFIMSQLHRSPAKIGQLYIALETRPHAEQTPFDVDAAHQAA